MKLKSNSLNNKQLIRIKRDQATGKIIDSEVKKVVVSTEDLFDVCIVLFNIQKIENIIVASALVHSMHYSEKRHIMVWR
jgi:hypothetical protein